MNRVDLELEQFMKPAKAIAISTSTKTLSGPRTPVCGFIDNGPGLGANVPLGKDEKTPNLFHNCRQRGVKDPQQITANELKAQFLVCKHNIELLERHSLYFA
jgi:hypothetical protein